jgi:SAM-dependent methyltransferase
MTGYVFDNAAEGPTARRFAGLEALYDARTRRALEATGIGPGWRCLEVGAGGGSVAAWLAGQVGADGHVLATDLDPRFLSALPSLDRANVEIRRHDVAADPLPIAEFDLVHARLVLVHLPAAADVLARLAATLRPNGWLVVEDFDPTFVDRAFPIADPENAAVARRVFGVLGELLEARGAGPGWARGLHGRVAGAGLVDIVAEGNLEIRMGGSPGAQVDAANLEQTGPALIAAGTLETMDFDRMLTLLADPGFTYASPVMFVVRGRRPAEANRTINEPSQTSRTT